MKKSTLILSTVLCFGAVHMSVAQPNSPTYGRALAEAKQSIQAKNYAEAESSAQRSLTLATSTDEKCSALILLGESFYQRKMYAQAVTQWDQVVALDNSKEGVYRMLAHHALARSYAIQGDAENAIAQCTAASVIIDAEPDFDEGDKDGARTVFALLVADAYFRAPQLDAAKEQFTQILEDSEDEAFPTSIALFKLGQIEMLRNNYQAATMRFNQVLSVEGATADIKKQAQVQLKVLKVLLPYEAKAKDINNGVKITIKDNIDQTIIEDLVDQMVLDSF